MKTKRGRAEVKEVMLYFVFVSALLQFLTGGEGQDIYHVLTHPIHQGHVTLPWFFVQENITLVGGENQPTPSHYYLFLSQFTQLLLVKHKYLCPKTYMKYVREKKGSVSFSCSQLVTGYYSILQTRLFLSPSLKYGHMNPICKIFDH